jgi:hypothetical protein
MTDTFPTEILALNEQFYLTETPVKSILLLNCPLHTPELNEFEQIFLNGQNPFNFDWVPIFKKIRPSFYYSQCSGDRLVIDQKIRHVVDHLNKKYDSNMTYLHSNISNTSPIPIVVGGVYPIPN